MSVCKIGRHVPAHTMNLTTKPAFFPAKMLRALAFGALLTLAAQAADEARRNYNLTAGDAAAALRQFSEASGRETLYAAEVVRGVQTNAVQGEFTALEALNRMLAGTSLYVVQDEKSGALAVKKIVEEPKEKNGPSRPAEASTAGTDSSLVKLEAYTVNATKVDGLINRGLLQAGENAPLYHDVVTRFDIERLGISSIEELFRYIPQTSSAGTALQTQVGNTSFSGGLSHKYSTVGLRGFSSAQTVVLVNGRAMPRTSLSTSGGADIGRIPIAAIERVEILPYAGSAIYGAGALGGAINIILRKEFSGRDLTTYVGTSTEGGATEYRITYLEGLRFNSGRTNLTLTLSYQHREGLRANERDYLAEALRRYGPDSTARNAQGVRYFEQLILPALAGTPGTILVGNAPTAAVNDLGIPGAPGARFAAIPAGTTVAQSLLLTPDAFTATADKANLGQRYGRSLLYEPVDSYNLNAQLEHEFIKDKLEAYGEFTLVYNRKDYSMPQVLSVSLNGTDPLNPFRTGVTPGFVGRPVTIFFDTPDLPDPSVLYEYDAARAVAGLKGRISPRWEWTLDGTIDYGHSTVRSNNPISNLTALEALTPYSSPGPAAAAASRRAVYALLADHGRFPLSEGDAAKYFDNIRYSFSQGMQHEGNARLMGEVFDLPAGPLRASTVGKYQQWEFESGQKFSGSDAWSQLIHNEPFDPGETASTATRKIWQGALEISVPVIGGHWRPVPFIEAFELQGSVSHERDTSAGTDANGDPFTNRQSASSSVVAGRLQLTPTLAFRASYSEGFYPPDWSDVSLPTTSFSLPGFFPDPKRGNTMQFTPNMSIMQGGNPGLHPETAESENYGLIFTPRRLPGFSLNVDFWRIEKVDAIVSTSFVDIIANPEAFGFLITREAPTAADAALGWLGRITAVDARAFNASVTRTEGFDTRVRYNLETTSLGTFGFTASASFTNHFLLLATPTAPIINTAGGSGPNRWRGNASVTWGRNRWTATLTGRYVGHRSTVTTDPSQSYPGAYPIDGGRIPAYLHADVQATYEIPYGGRGGNGWLHGTKWTLGIQNVANDRPAFVSDGAGFYNGVDDPRQRFVYMQIRKSL